MPKDDLTHLRERLSKLRLLTESPKGIDFDFVKNYAAKAISKGKEFYKIRHEVHTPKRHKLVEELALTSQFLSKCKNVLQAWEVDLLQRYESFPDTEVIAWIKSEWEETWDTKQLRKEILRIKRNLGAHNEPLSSRATPTTHEKPKFVDMVKDVIEDVKKGFLKAG